jgi:hypothetical protein
VYLDMLILTELFAVNESNPNARRTWLGSNDFEEHALPVDV